MYPKIGSLAQSARLIEIGPVVQGQGANGVGLTHTGFPAMRCGDVGKQISRPGGGRHPASGSADHIPAESQQGLLGFGDPTSQTAGQGPGFEAGVPAGHSSRGGEVIDSLGRSAGRAQDVGGHTRLMPLHLGCRAPRTQAISSPLRTHPLPGVRRINRVSPFQAARSWRRQKEKRVSEGVALCKTPRHVAEGGVVTHFRTTKDKLNRANQRKAGRWCRPSAA
jgi:hypothetical protein